MNGHKSRLHPLVTVADSQEQTAAADVAKIIKEQRVLREQIATLKAYSHEYDLNARGLTQSNASFSDRRLFLLRLNKTISQLGEQDEVIDQKLLQQMDRWKKSKNWVKSLEKLVQKQYFTHQEKVQRAEQKEQDDLAGRLVRKTL